MGLLDKLKDLFVDEVVEDDEIELEEEVKEEYKKPKDVLPKVMRDNIAVSEKKEASTPKFRLEDLEPKKDLPKRESVKKEVKPEIKEEPIVKKETKKFDFPLDLEKEYTPKKSSNINVLDIEKEKIKEKERIEEKRTLYPPKEEPVTKSKFKASPVISPVYGVLDKNYKKDEVIEKEEDDASLQRASKKVDFESVRKKAFGNLADDIKDNLMCENCELYKEAKRINSLKEDDLLYDMTVEENEPVTIEKAYDNYEAFGVAYEPEKKTTKEEQSIIINHNEEKAEASKIEIKEKPTKVELPSREQKNKVEEEPKEEIELKKEKVDDDFFDLIDSMYKERNEE